MRMIYTNANRIIVGNAKNILESHGFAIAVKNEHAASAIGEVSAFDSWVELWIINDSEYDDACTVLANSLSKDSDHPWICKSCGEENDLSFELCWNCSTERA